MQLHMALAGPHMHEGEELSAFEQGSISVTTVWAQLKPRWPECLTSKLLHQRYFFNMSFDPNRLLPSPVGASPFSGFSPLFTAYCQNECFVGSLLLNVFTAASRPSRVES